MVQCRIADGSVSIGRGEWTMTKQTPSPDADAGNRAKVFVSYSRKDLAFAQSLVSGARGARLRRLSRQDRHRAWRAVERTSRRLDRGGGHRGFRDEPGFGGLEVCTWELEESTRRGKRLVPWWRGGSPTRLRRRHWGG